MDHRSHRSSRRHEPSRDDLDQRTQLNRDHSTRPSKSQKHRDEPSGDYFDRRTQLIRDQGTRPSQSHQHRDESSRNDFDQRTKLIRDHSRPGQSQQHRNDPSRDDVDQGTKLIRDHSTRPSQSHHHRQESSHAPSILRTDLDETIASRQAQIQTLAPVERQEQEQWAQKQIQLTGACVGKFAWTRVEGGYRCGSGNCKVTDELLAEGKGGYLAAYPHINSRHPDLFDEKGITWLDPEYKGRRMQAPRQVFTRFR